MLWWRALRRGQRRYMPEITWGATYSEAEMNEIQMEAEVVESDEKPERVEEQSIDYSHEIKQIRERLDGTSIKDMKAALDKVAAKIQSWPEEPFYDAKAITLPYATKMYAHKGGPDKRDALEDWITEQTQKLPTGLEEVIRTECIEALNETLHEIADSDDDDNEDKSDSADGLPFDEDAKLTPQTRKRLHAVGKDLYGDEWDEKRAELVEYVTDGRTNSAAEITDDEGREIINGMNEKRDEEEKSVLTDQ